MTPEASSFFFLNIYAILLVSCVIFAVIAALRHLWQRVGMYVVAIGGLFIGFCNNLWAYSVPMELLNRWMDF